MAASPAPVGALRRSELVRGRPGGQRSRARGRLPGSRRYARCHGAWRQSGGRLRAHRLGCSCPPRLAVPRTEAADWPQVRWLGSPASGNSPPSDRPPCGGSAHACSPHWHAALLSSRIATLRVRHPSRVHPHRASVPVVLQDGLRRAGANGEYGSEHSRDDARLCWQPGKAARAPIPVPIHRPGAHIRLGLSRGHAGSACSAPVVQS